MKNTIRAAFAPFMHNNWGVVGACVLLFLSMLARPAGHTLVELWAPWLTVYASLAVFMTVGRMYVRLEGDVQEGFSWIFLVTGIALVVIAWLASGVTPTGTIVVYPAVGDAALHILVGITGAICIAIACWSDWVDHRRDEASAARDEIHCAELRDLRHATV